MSTQYFNSNKASQYTGQKASQYTGQKASQYTGQKASQYTGQYTGQKAGNNKFCKICYDAGKDKSVYSSHYVKSGSIVICPTLKATECRYCRKMGHTIKFCKVLNEKNNYLTKPTKTTTNHNQKKMEQSKPIVKIENIFESLDNDSDDDEKELEINSRWTRGPAVITPPEPQLKGWANIVAASPKKDSTSPTSTFTSLTLSSLSKTKESRSELQSVIHTNNKVLAANANTSGNANTSANIIASIINRRPTQIKNWADYTDSDSEDEDDCGDNKYDYNVYDECDYDNEEADY